MPEPIRLVIWDLDETFWKGTITEGGIEFNPLNAETVAELARRGIMSSICSKNDFGAVKEIMTHKKVWDYFIFPSIEWTAKGPRIQSLIETVQLRPETILFIDDNPSNLQEAQHFVPKLQVANPSILSGILDNPQFRGKNDSSLGRLNQYKALEKRKADEVVAGSDVTEFLRSCNIQVRLEFDIEPHIDRVVELINRTNQLNFTKTRLPEDLVEARAQALREFKAFNIQAALVHVTDRYGDHGYCGFYAHHSGSRRLRHFCFSCRILGMGIEQWLYEKLGRPKITVHGKVLSDLSDRSGVIDWINQPGTGSAATDKTEATQFPFTAVTARGSCDLAAIIHYFMLAVPDAVGEYFVHRQGGTFRIDHSIFLRYAIKGLSSEALAAAKELGFVDEDFQTRLFSPHIRRHLVLLSFAADAYFSLYRHRKSGLTVPFPMLTKRDARLLNSSEVPANWVQQLQFLKDEFDHLGRISEDDFKANLDLILSNLPRSANVYILTMLDKTYRMGYKILPPRQRYLYLNRWVRDVCVKYPNVTLLNASEFVRDGCELINRLHYKRSVYFRIYRKLNALAAEAPPAHDAALPNVLPGGENYSKRNTRTLATRWLNSLVTALTFGRIGNKFAASRGPLDNA